jgi:hypothetical protein
MAVNNRSGTTPVKAQSRPECSRQSTLECIATSTESPVLLGFSSKAPAETEGPCLSAAECRRGSNQASSLRSIASFR